ncbi:Heat shock protein. Metallo peptidase. MEROPS family M48B [Alteribacillus persepolensis]|uniref:Protease HtpX homolog n=1 Tax=Alteribacillus persepolensis TaxID=568899 RepID=A0A1G8GEV3_9BACI|nr:protease HtpX [Alteribacillus persepolensis]SDH92934.1 Heat shock protein. Metallo peptidase. MEROPS family M48B [Alteribacillus persepolensis]
MGKRILLFILTNILVITTITIVFTLLRMAGVDISTYTADGGINYGSLFIISAVIGFTGSFISLALSRFMAKKMMGVKVIDPNNCTGAERAVVEKVHRLSRSAGFMHMPEVGIYHSREVNAFATGPSKKRSLVAVSTGLLQSMDEDAVEGVLAHEVAHISNGDMVTMTLLQGVVNTFVVFFARIAAAIVSRFVQNDAMRIFVHFGAIIVFQILFSILGSIVVMGFSRYREYHADRGGADLAGKDKMTHALKSLQAHVNRVETNQTSMQTLKINNKPSVALLFSSHPPLDERIKRLQAK